MGKCPALKNGCCKNQGMLMVNGLTNPDICTGHIRNGEKYTDCKYYKKKTGTSEKMKPCPLCIRVDKGTWYRPYCRSTKFPGADGENGIIVKDEDQAVICLGHQVGNKTYTSCKYYKGGKPKATKSKK